jgi:hypothetical protein
MRNAILLSLLSVLVVGCTSSDDDDSSGATKGYLVIYADQPPTGAQVYVSGQLRGTLTASYSNGSPGCFGPDGVSAPTGTVVVTLFVGQTYPLDIRYTNGTSDQEDFVASQDVIDAFCYRIGTHPN